MMCSPRRTIIGYGVLSGADVCARARLSTRPRYRCYKKDHKEVVKEEEEEVLGPIRRYADGVV